MNDERDDYADRDLPAPRQLLVEAAVTLGMVVALIGLLAGMLLLSIVNGPRFD